VLTKERGERRNKGGELLLKGRREKQKGGGQPGGALRVWEENQRKRREKECGAAARSRGEKREKGGSGKGSRANKSDDRAKLASWCKRLTLRRAEPALNTIEISVNR